MSTTTPDVTDTRVMNTLHTFFRREHRLAGGLLRGVADGDTARAKVVGAHLDFLLRALHHHHTIEDRVLWPLLLERVPDELAPIVHLMESQHQRVDGLIGEIGALLPGWVRDADAVTANRLADLFDTLYVHLAEHLDAEEERLLPIAARCMTQAEWDHMGEVARREAPREEGMLALGMFQHDGDPEVFAQMLGDAPAPVRWLLPRLARRAFRRHALAVHGTATP
ncbi:hemerythrin domain-containing protein [Nocardioides pinisoli]|uniref:Hemerythrin domain-containing protein n=1 Tax=Nocardioides pinisoli TaxID=2950279 RepID=A0ABT1KX48_9ACTN|nr:hemerythrin domain-containing protein [Nocardioides pinisoli]MCP3422341.1 hemerythrin domain-containing protein [Nocardioides pinisoli]